VREKLLAQVATYQQQVEGCLAIAAREFLKAKRVGDPASNVIYDLRQSFVESMALSQGGDWCYDRFTTGLMYGLYYQGRRINTSLTFAVDFVADALREKKPIEVFDLGAGAGAVHIAVGLCVQAAHDLGYALPKIRLINVDISPFMLEYAQSYLVPALKTQFNAGFHQVNAEYEAVSWTNPHNLQLTNPYVVGSYVFDHSDTGQTVVKTFNGIIERFDPECVVLLTSWHKRHLVHEFANQHLDGTRYATSEIARDFVYAGPIIPLQKLRLELSSTYGVDIGRHQFVKWDIRSFYGCYVNRRALKMGMVTEAEAPRLDLYRPPIKVRRDVVLSPDQLRAARPNDRPTIILGSAGSGKSVVITERIKNVIEGHRYGQHLNILLTSFNKELVRFLRRWMVSLLDAKRITRSGKDEEHFHFDGNPAPNLTILNFDTLPTRIGGLSGQLKFDHDGLADYVRTATTEIVAEQGIDAVADARYLDWHFVYSEYVRVIYGQLALTREQYLKCRRYGREHNPGERVRNYLFDIIRRFQELLLNGNRILSPADTIHTRRQKFYRLLEEGTLPRYSHIFVDEFQDCTVADYHLFYGLLKDNNQLVIAGDYAQAVHLGSSVIAPRENDQFAGREAMRNWDRNGNNLSGSYRLPFRITECIRPLSQKISRSRSDVKVNLLNPYKGAPPGARPILVYAPTEAEMVTKLSWINRHFGVFDLTDTHDLSDHERRQIVILERDKSLCKAINERAHFDLATTDTILRLKGMEKDCIVWSTRVDVDSPGDEDYYVYTILTRTRSVLIVALFDETPQRYREIVKLFNRKQMMLWDRETEEHYRERVLGELAVV